MMKKKREKKEWSDEFCDLLVLPTCFTFILHCSLSLLVTAGMRMRGEKALGTELKSFFLEADLVENAVLFKLGSSLGPLLIKIWWGSMMAWIHIKKRSYNSMSTFYLLSLYFLFASIFVIQMHFGESFPIVILGL